jgi:hypothetical protein
MIRRRFWPTCEHSGSETNFGLCVEGDGLQAVHYCFGMNSALAAEGYFRLNPRPPQQKRDSANRNGRKKNLYRCDSKFSTARGILPGRQPPKRGGLISLFRLFRLFRNGPVAESRYASRRSTPRSRPSVPARAASAAAQTANKTCTTQEGATPTRCSRKGRKFQVVMCW